MLRLFRKKPSDPGMSSQAEEPAELEPVRAEEIDWAQRTVLVLPGSEAGISDKDGMANVGKAIGLAERMLMPSRSSEPVQIIAAGWDSFDECARRVRQFHHKNGNPEDYASADASQFVVSLRERLNTQRLSVLAWSYGSVFLQECANVARQGGIALDQVQALTLGTAVAPQTIEDYGINGAYLFGTNDAVIKKWMPHINEAVNALGRQDSLTITPAGERKMIITAPIPNRLERRKPLDLPMQRNLENDEKAHTAKSHAEAIGGSQALIGEEWVPAVAHTPVVLRCLNNLVHRKAPLTVEEMLQDCAHRLPHSHAQPLIPHPDDVTIAEALETGRKQLRTAC